MIKEKKQQKQARLITLHVRLILLLLLLLFSPPVVVYPWTLVLDMKMCICMFRTELKMGSAASIEFAVSESLAADPPIHNEMSVRVSLRILTTTALAPMPSSERKLYPNPIPAVRNPCA